MIIGLFIDLWNWWYTRNRIQLIRDAREIWQPHKLKISILGVLYTVVEVDDAVPDHLIDRFLSQRLAMVDDALVAINLDGLIHFKATQIQKTATGRYMLCKFIPNMPHWTWTYFLFSCLLAFVIIKLVMYFGLWAKFFDLIKPLLDAIY